MALSVIGAGLGRTGTTSLKVALEMLGFGPCHHMVELMANPSSWGFWTRAYAGERVDWEEGFNGYRACTDDPGTSFYAQLAARYPQAKVILTVRDPERWYESAKNSALSEEQRKLLESGPSEMQPVVNMITAMGWDARDPRTQSKDYMLAWFARHNAEVQRTISPERLLVYQASEGWNPLCRFLEVPVPSASFPHANTTQDYLTMLKTGQPPAMVTGPRPGAPVG